MADFRWRYAVVPSAVVLAYVAIKIRLFGLVFDRAKEETSDDWQRVSATPGANRGHSPQGIAFVNGDLVLSNHWDGERSCLYRLDPETGDVTAASMMPDEARHTSGLAWDGTSLWAVDHESNYLYKLDLADTFSSERASVEEKFETGLHGSSGLTFLEVDGAGYLALSDFLWTIETTPSLPTGTARTYIFRPEDVEAGRTVPDCAEVSYSNGGYSQGLAWDGEFLYESLNNVGTNRIEIIDISRVLRSGSGSIERLGSFETPGRFVEDLATDGSTIWTTDERLFALYHLDLASLTRDLRDDPA